jgi:hypothetical protein
MRTFAIAMMLWPIIGLGQDADPEIRTLEKQRDEAQQQLAAAKERLALKQRLDSAIEKRRELIARLEEADRKLATLRQARDEARARYREAAWARATGRTYDRLMTRSGKEYEEVVITKVTEKGVSIRHRNGPRDLTAEELPGELLAELDIDPEESAAAMAEEQRREIERRRTLEGAIARREEAGSPGPARPAATSREPEPIAPVAGQPASPEATIEKGKLTARPIRMFRGGKEVEFTAFTNCPATLIIYNVLPTPHTVRVPVGANEKTVVDYQVANDYRCELISGQGKLLDNEKTLRKSGLGDKPELGK